MIVHSTQVQLHNINAATLYYLMINPTDAKYNAWWPEYHHQFHIVKRADTTSHVGDVVFMDEHIGTRRLKSQWMVVVDEPKARIVWRMKKIIMLPASLDISMTDTTEGTRLQHTVRIGWKGVGAMLDPFIRLYFSRAYIRALDEHASTEFQRLGQ